MTSEIHSYGDGAPAYRGGRMSEAVFFGPSEHMGGAIVCRNKLIHGIAPESQAGIELSATLMTTKIVIR